MYAVIFGIYGEVGAYAGKYNYESVRFFASREDAMAFIGEYEGTSSPYPPASADEVGEIGWFCQLFELLDGYEYGDGWICNSQGSSVDPIRSAYEPYQKG